MPHLNDRDIMTDLLKDAKFKSTAYHMAALESANDRVRDMCVRFMHDELNAHKAVFDAMAGRGWYQVQPATPGPGAFAPGRFAPGPGTIQEPGIGRPPMVEGTYNPGFERFAEPPYQGDVRRYPEGRY